MIRGPQRYQPLVVVVVIVDGKSFSSTAAVCLIKETPVGRTAAGVLIVYIYFDLIVSQL